MKVSEMIKNLQEFIENYEDVECWYASDDEGNEYHEVYFEPSYHFVNMDGEIVTLADIEEFGYKDDEIEPVCIIN